MYPTNKIKPGQLCPNWLPGQIVFGRRLVMMNKKMSSEKLENLCLR